MRSWFTLAVVSGLVLTSAAGLAAPPGRATSADARRTDPPRKGRPQVHLASVVLPEGTAHAALLRKHLSKLLTREARRAEWGVGRGAKVTFSFAVTDLTISDDGDVLHVRCTAVGKLPGGRSAKSNLSFGGDPGKRFDTVKRVLEIVARGVVTRLAEMARVKRGDLQGAVIRAPSASGE